MTQLQRSRWWHAVLMACALGPVWMPALHAQEPEAVGEMAEVRNEVVGTVPGSQPTPLAVGDDLVLHHLIETRAAAEARMALGTEGREGNLYLGPETQVTLDQNLVNQASRRTSRFSVLVGVIRLKLTDFFNGEINIETPTATVGVKGTDVQVEVDENGETRVTVFEGVVSVLSRALGELLELSAGESTVVRPSGTPGEADGFDSGDGGTQDSRNEPRQDQEGRDQGRTDDQAQQEPDEPDKGQQDRPASVAAGSCPARAQAGQPVCICGSFPATVGTASAGTSPSSGGRRGQAPAAPATGFTLDGQIPLTVLNRTSSGVTVRLPRQMEAGGHTLASPAGSCKVDVLVLDAGFDGPLKQGRAPKYELRVYGTREKLRIRLENRTPGIIRIRGGNDQVVTTSGGRNNRARLRVKATADGDAILATTILGLPQCPCAVSIE